MKKPTEEESIFEILLDIENNCVDAESSIDNVMHYVKEHTKHNIEALREELKSNGRYKHFKPDRDAIDKIFNQFLENIK